MEKINIAELLKDCPKGMELYSPLCGECRVLNIYDGLGFDVICGDNAVYNFSYDGRFNIMGECCIFPSKENRDWSKFQRPFKDGDVISDGNTIAIFNKSDKPYTHLQKDTVYYHCWYNLKFNEFKAKIDYGIGAVEDYKYATEEEKEKLFKAIKDNGYKWNAETKTLETPRSLEKLIKPWSIQDAKDGDILAFNNETIIIFKDLYNKTSFHSYCYIEEGIFTISKEDMPDWWEGKGFYPATEEQRAFLFRKIKEAGYKWNPETKTLEKLPKFKDGDIIYTETHISEWISIFEKFDDDECKCYIDYSIDSDTYYGEVGGKKNTLCEINDIEEQRLATEEEKQKLFDVIKENGHRWNAETKTLEKLIEPKFKVGDIITKIDGSKKGEIFYIDIDRYHVAVSNDIGIDVFFEDQDDWELIYGTKPRFKVGDRIKNKHTCEIVTVKRVYELYYIVELNDTEMFLDRKLGEDYELVLIPDRFDINTLIPFESKVLVRDYVGKIWRPAFWGKYIEDSNCRYLTTNGCWVQCIPYEENKHLLGTTNDCVDFYKTW